MESQEQLHKPGHIFCINWATSPKANPRAVDKDQAIVVNLQTQGSGRCEWKDESGKFMDSILEQKSFQFAVRIVKLCKHLRNSKKEYILSKQLLRAGTSIGANIAEAQQAQSKADFISKLSIALKETTETKYWIRLMSATDYLSAQEYQSIFSDCVELEKMLVASVKTAKDS